MQIKCNKKGQYNVVLALINLGNDGNFNSTASLKVI